MRFTPSPVRVARRHIASAPLILRPEGWSAVSDEALDALNSWRKSGHVYRAMTETEYKATVGARKPVWSTGEWSHSSEGTNFSDDPLDAESYVNFGRTDPRKTGKPTYLVEVSMTDSMSRWRDGYIKSPVPVPYDNVTRVWEMTGEDGAVVARRIK